MARDPKETPGRQEKGWDPAVGADRLIAELAARGDGQITRERLAAVGVSDNQIALRVARGQLVRRGRGVYGFGLFDRDPAARLRTAVLTIGGDALVSHLAAAAHWGCWPMPSVIDITCPRWLPRRDGLRPHQARVDPAEIRCHHGIPLTSAARTLFDLGTVLGAKSHARVANEAFVLRLVSFAELRATRSRNVRRKGSAAFERLLGALDPAGHRVASPLEARLGDFLRARGFPPWESNVTLEVGAQRIRPDVLWRVQRVAVEADGRDPHSAPLRFASDRRRDRRLRVEGWEPVRVTSIDLDLRPDELEADLRALLGKRGAGTPAR